MTTFSNLLKAEIVRLARKEVRAETQGLKKSISPHRSAIADLKRRVSSLERDLKRQGRSVKNSAPSRAATAPMKLRFSAKGLAAQRKRLGLSAKDCGLLVGASGLSIYHWENGKVRPRDKHLPAIAALRKMGKREAAARLAELSE